MTTQSKQMMAEAPSEPKMTAGRAPKTAVVGCGYWGKNLVRNFANLNALGGIYDNDVSVATSLSEKFGAPVNNFTDILASPDIDAVAIAAPAERHFVIAQEALLSDKHVFVEKPLALDTKEAEILCDLAEDRGLVLMVGHLLQYHPGFLRLKKMVKDGELGRLQYIYSNRLNFGKIRREENILWSFAPHDISMILSLVGEEPDHVFATGSYYLHKQIADVTTTHLSFPNGNNAHVFVSWLHPVKEQKLVVVGERKMAVFDDNQDWNSKLVMYPHYLDWLDGMPSPVMADAVPVEIEQSEPLALECGHFLECIREGKIPRTDGREGLRVLRVLQAAQSSMTDGNAVTAASAGSAVAAITPQPAKAQPADDKQIHESAYVDEPCWIGAGTKIWHFSHVLKGSRIGRNCVLGQNVMVGPDVLIGDNCKIQNNVSIYKGITLEEGVFCGPSCVFTNVHNPRAEVERKEEFRETIVGKGASIGANATIVCGNNVGKYSFVAAGAVVTKDVPPHAVVAGVPARQIGWMSHDGEILGDDFTCPRSGRRYKLQEKDKLVEEHYA